MNFIKRLLKKLTKNQGGARKINYKKIEEMKREQELKAYSYGYGRFNF